MTTHSDFFLATIFIGVGATIVMDVWAILMKRCFGIPSLSYSMVGRWIGHFPKGRFSHNSIAQATPVYAESIIGWTCHYMIGVVFAGLLLSICGLAWAHNPSLLPALGIGIITVAAPFFIMQPGMGAGIAAAKTPHPNTARLRSLIAHSVFGVGLYIAALVYAHFIH